MASHWRRAARRLICGRKDAASVRKAIDPAGVRRQAGAGVGKGEALYSERLTALFHLGLTLGTWRTPPAAAKRGRRDAAPTCGSGCGWMRGSSHTPTIRRSGVRQPSHVARRFASWWRESCFRLRRRSAVKSWPRGSPRKWAASPRTRPTARSSPPKPWWQSSERTGPQFRLSRQNWGSVYLRCPGYRVLALIGSYIISILADATA